MARNFSADYTYHRHFSALRGVDFSSDPSEVSHSHFTHLENMWCDPVTLDGVATEVFPGYRTFARFALPIYGIYRHRVAGEDYLVVHSGENLYRFSERLRNFERTLASISPLPVTVPRTEGCSFSYGDSLCLLIGGKYLMIDKEGTVHTPDGEESLAYAPTTYLNGEPYEQRNLLSDRVRISFSADGPYKQTVGAEGLVFSVYSEADKSCSVCIAERYRGAGCVEIPDTAVIGGEKYTVRRIAAHGFTNMTGLASITLPTTIKAIGACAFLGDSALTSLSLSEGVEQIGAEAFYGCLSLEKLYLGGTSLARVGRDAFAYCLSLKEIRYGGDESAYAAIDMEGETNLHTMDVTVSYQNDVPYDASAVFYRYPLIEKCLSLESITLDGVPLEENFVIFGKEGVRYQAIMEDGLYTHIELTATSDIALIGKRLTATVQVSPIRFSLPSGAVPFGDTGREALCGCTKVVKYDGRVFFTGNPNHPNTVFYSALDDTGVNNPFYIGCLNYFNDGTGAVANRGFLVTGGLLAVLKADAGGEGEIFFHAPSSTGENLIPRIYPTVATAQGMGLLGSAVAFGDEAVFLGKDGLFALERCQNENERVLSPRSSSVNLRLLRERLDGADMAVFEGLLYLLSGGNVYLADKRRRTRHTGGSAEYEWYFLSGIGSYVGDVPVYRYTSYLPPRAAELSLSVHPLVGTVAEGEICSATLSDGTYIYYAENGDGRFPVDTDGERTGGVFSPAEHLCATDEALYFGTKDGSVGCFNTDKRGKAMYRPMQSELYIKSKTGLPIKLNGKLFSLFSEDTVEEREVFYKEGDAYISAGHRTVFCDYKLAVLAEPIGEYETRNRVHRYYYSFAGHAYPALCALATDDGGFPHLSKDTLPLSAALKLKTPEGSRLSVFVRTDRHPFVLCDQISATNADAGDADFSAFDFHSDSFATVPLREKERGWCYKQYLFRADVFRAPFGIFSLSYSFRPSGRIKP